MIGKHVGMYRERGPSGRTFEVAVCTVYRFAESGLLQSEDVYFDHERLLRGLTEPRTASPTIDVRWRRQEGKSEYYYGETGTRFTAQIGVAMEGGYAWMAFTRTSRAASTAIARLRSTRPKDAVMSCLRTMARLPPEPG